MAEFYTYQYYDPIKREPFYIGKGKGLRAYNLRQRSIHFKNRIEHIKAQGATAEVHFLCKDVDEELAFLCEAEAIDLYGRRDLGKGPLLNYTDGGDGHSNPSAEARNKMRMTHLGKQKSAEHRAKLKNCRNGEPSWNKGIPMSEESKAKMAFTKTGKPFSEEHCKKLSEVGKLAWIKRKENKNFYN